MSHLYGSLRGSRGEATRCGSNHIQAHVRGWDLGVLAEVFRGKDGEDTANVTLSGGSLGRHPGFYLGSYTETDLEALNRYRQSGDIDQVLAIIRRAMGFAPA